MRQATPEEIADLKKFDPRLKFFFADEVDEFMEVALSARQESTDKKHSTGAVVVKDGQILSMESNKAGYTLSFMIKLHEKGMCLRKWLRIPSGKGYFFCKGCATSKNHAESRAARSAFEKHAQKTKGATLYLAGHWWCCAPCTKAMIEAGIENVVLEEGAAAKYKR